MPEKRERRTRGKGRPILPPHLRGKNPKPLIQVFEEKLFEQTSEDEDGNVVREELFASLDENTGKIVFRATAEKEVSDADDKDQGHEAC
jgi:hypothetical protein